MTRTKMSAPELPPILDKDKSRPTSRSTSTKSSLHQMSAAVKSKNIYNRLKAAVALPRYHSDTSLTGPDDRKSPRDPSVSTSKNSQLRTASRNNAGTSLKGFTSSQQHRSLEPVSSHPVAVVGRTSGQVGEATVPPAGRRQQSSRALSWCAAETSLGSTPRLETLFEKRDAVNNNNVPVLDSSSNGHKNGVSLAAALEDSSCNNSSHVLNNNNNNNNNNNTPENGTHLKKDSKDLAQLAMPGMRARLQSEGGTSEPRTARTSEHAQTVRGKVGSMRRSMSDNKLVDKKGLPNASLGNSSGGSKRQLHSSVTSRDRTLDWKQAATNGRQGAPASKDRVLRVNSVSVLNAASSSNHTQSRQDSVFADANNEGEERSADDSAVEDEERKQRIAEWLIGAESAEAPPEPDIDYSEDPPQTDTAVHIVHEED